MLKPSGARGRGGVADVCGGVGLPRPTRYDRGDTTRRRRCVPEDQERALFTTAEAAAQLGIKHATVKTAVNRGLLRVERVNPRLNLITAEAIKEYRRTHLGRQGRPRGARNEPKSAADEDGAGENGAAG